MATLMRFTVLAIYVSDGLITKCGGWNLVICTLVWLVMASGFYIPCICSSNDDMNTVGSNPLQRGFQVSPSQISIQWATFRPFLSSPQGTFCLGFQETNLMASNMDRCYVLSIMYTIRVNNGSLTGSPNPNSTLEDEPFNMVMVWSANRDIPIGLNSIFSIGDNGYMALLDTDNGSNMTNVWCPTKSGGNSGVAVVGQSLKLEENGNLVFMSNESGNNGIAWQSFDHPTDTILSDQNFTASMSLTVSIPELIATMPSTNVSFNLKMESDGMALYVNGIGRNASDRTIYWKLLADQETAFINPSGGPIYARMERMGYLAMYQTEDSRVSYQVFETYNLTNVYRRRMKLDSDGNMRVYYWAFPSWNVDYRAVSEFCDLPSSCGLYGICSGSNNSNAIGGTACECPHPLVRVNESNAMQGCALLNDGKQRHNTTTSICSSNANGAKPQVYASVQGVRNLFHQDELMNTNLSWGSRTTSLPECETECNVDCDCVAYFFSNSSAIPCSLAYHTVLAVQSSNRDDDVAFLKMGKVPILSSSMPPITTSFKRPYARSHLVKIIIPIFSCLVALGVALLLVSYMRRRHKSRSLPLEEQSVLRTPPT